MNVLDKQLCLVLNKHWIPVGTRTVKESIVCMCSENHGEHPAHALDIEINGEELVYANPVNWEVWITLPIREGDLFISTSRGKIRAPLILICRHYASVPMTRPRLSSGNIYERDQGICQYTGRKLSRAEASVDHVLPRFRGGVDSWTNCVTTSKKLNTAKGSRLNEEIGLKLIKQPKAPNAIPISASIKEARHPHWLPFLVHSS